MCHLILILQAKQPAFNVQHHKWCILMNFGEKKQQNIAATRFWFVTKDFKSNEGVVSQ